MTGLALPDPAPPSAPPDPAPPSAPRAPAPGPAGLQAPELAADAFRRIAAIAYREAGLAIGEGRSAMVRTRLARRLRALNLPGFEAYCDHIESPAGADEVGLLISALTTNVSHFFRESHHFDILRSDVIPPLAARARAGERVRIWSAGCANGQEPYSVAMTLIDEGVPPDADVRVLGTDIDPAVIAHAGAGQYPETMLSGLPDPMRARHFAPAPGGREPHWAIDETVRGLVSFRVLNLLDAWPMRGRFDAIFCRNVVIYFDAATQDRLWHRFAAQLAPGGWLFLGHSERLSPGAKPLFAGRGVTTYQRTERSGAPSEGP